MNQIEPTPVMTVREVARFLQVSDSTVYRLAQTGELPARKVGGAWRFSRRTLEEWLGKQESNLVVKRQDLGE